MDLEQRAKNAEKRAEEIEEKAKKMALLVKQERDKWAQELFNKESEITEWKEKI